MDLKEVLRELRLMRAQPAHRFYTLVSLVILTILSEPVAMLLASALALWLGLKQGN